MQYFCQRVHDTLHLYGGMRRIGCWEERWAADPGFLTTEWSDDEGLLWGGKVEQQEQGCGRYGMVG